MSIETVFRVNCGGCSKYLPSLNSPLASAEPVTEEALYADTFSTYRDAYDGAVRRGWSAYPLVCPGCAAGLKELVQRVEVRGDGDTEEDRRGLPESGQGPERAA